MWKQGGVCTALHCGMFCNHCCRGNSNIFLPFLCWHRCSCQQYKCVHCCHENNNGFLLRLLIYTILHTAVNSIEYFECVSILALLIRCANCVFSAQYYIVICGLSGSTIFPHYFLNGTIFWKNLLNIKLCFDFCYNSCLKHFSF